MRRLSSPTCAPSSPLDANTATPACGKLAASAGWPTTIHATCRHHLGRLQCDAMRRSYCCCFYHYRGKLETRARHRFSDRSGRCAQKPTSRSIVSMSNVKSNWHTGGALGARERTTGNFIRVGARAQAERGLLLRNLTPKFVTSILIAHKTAACCIRLARQDEHCYYSYYYTTANTTSCKSTAAGRPNSDWAQKGKQPTERNVN